ncbi:hypothetical protein GCM10017559_60030 [Streptosporangium longisporum]|uniref:Uncharacterized protein n=1 Tax=Streptosporangium longisporum TaxID=46187 RepID=A0ABP6L0G1_9ACTN
MTLRPAAVTVLGDAVFSIASDETCTGTTVEVPPVVTPVWVGVSALENSTVALLFTVVPGELAPSVTRNLTEVDWPGARLPPLTALAPVPSRAWTWLLMKSPWSSPVRSVLAPMLGPVTTEMLPGT